MKGDNTKKGVTLWQAVLICAVSVILAIALIVGNIFANLYENLITVFFSSSDYSVTKEEENKCREVESEGAVLLKNEGNALPLVGNERVALLGQDSVDFMYGGAGSGSMDTANLATLKDSFEQAGFTVDSTVWDFYTTGAGKNYRKTYPNVSGAGIFAVNEVPADVYTDAFKNSLSHDDVAVVSLGRGGGESSDLPTGTQSTDKYTSIGYKYLEADQNELDLIRLACSKFDKVILLVNSSNAMELGFLDQPEYANVKAALWVGAVGQTGIMAIGEILSGKVNPSGRLADTYAYDSQSAPSFQNFGSYTLDGATDTHGKYYMVYAEGIYVGYKYYETRYEDVVLDHKNVGEYDYASTVQYPFGYGLSYSTFAWSGFSMTEKENSFEFSVNVKNNGTIAGKDVVEIYMQSPYTDYDKENNIEKSAIELVGYAKTNTIAGGGEETVTVTIDKEMMKAYDYTNKKTYIVDNGTYFFTAGKDAHDALNNILAAKSASSEKMTEEGNVALVATYEQAQFDAVTYAVSQETGNKISNQFNDVDVNYYENFTYLTRSDWNGTFPKNAYKNGSWSLPEQLKNDLEFYRADEVINNSEDTENVYDSTSTSYTVTDLTEVAYNDEKWDSIVNQLSWSDMTRLVRLGGYSTIKIDKIGLPMTQDKDGPSGISGTLVGGTSCMAWPVETVFASTWNDVLIEEVGVMIGTESIESEIAGWYAPGVNIHRSPYSGRNFEYFSEDGILSGKIGAAEMRGVRSKGVIAYMKHFALNDQETNRYGGCIFANEQAIREVFLKGFEYIVREGNAIAAMASMNRIGARWTGAHKGLINNTLREEWGFCGMVITDQASVVSMSYQDMISGLWAGTDLWLNTNAQLWSLTNYKNNETVMANVHRAAKNIIYTIANSNAVQDYTNNGVKTATNGIEAWRIGLIVVDVVIFAACAVGIVFSLRMIVKKRKES
jgi:beta-glucosidase